MIADKIPQLDDLDANEKLLLVSELWDSLTAGRLDIPVSDSLFEELDRRHEEYLKDPSQVTSWEDAKRRIRDSRD